MKNSIAFLLISLSSAIILTSCGGDKKDTAAASASFDQAKSKVATDIDKVLHDLPSPSEIPFLLQATGAEFNSELLSNISKASSYATSIDKAAMNLGIYATDVGYLASYEQVQMALKYMEGCQSLAEVLGIASSFDLALLSRFEENLGKRDSLAKLLNDAMVFAELRLEDDDRLNTAALILAGSFIEGLYLSTMVVETYPDNLLSKEEQNAVMEPLIKIVLDQKKPLSDLIKMMEDVPSDAMISTMTEEMRILKIIYDNQLSEIENKLADKNSGFVLSKDALSGISYELKRIRNKIRE